METLEGIDVMLVTLGDSAYPLLPWLMKPFPESKKPMQATAAL